MPVVKSFILCDKVIHDQIDGKHSAIGIFDRIMAPAFPCQHGPFGLILLLTDAEGSYNFVVDLVHIETDKLIAKAQFPTITINDRLEGANVALQFPVLEFPTPGRYEFRLSADGSFIDRRDLELKLVPSAEA